MDDTEKTRAAIEILQQLGLKEYEARCFVGLSRLETGTAKQLSELTDVPRTRVYGAVRVLESQGLVEIQHSNPQQFRAIPLDEATKTLRGQHEARIEQLRDTLETLDPLEEEDDSTRQEVWSMTGRTAIENRTIDLIEGSSDEVVLVIGEESLLTANLLGALNDIDDSVELLIGAVTEQLQNRVLTAVPEATSFVSGLEWLHSEDDTYPETTIGRLLLVDGSTILVSSIGAEDSEEQAVFGEGFENGLVVLARRLMSQGLTPTQDPSP